MLSIVRSIYCVFLDGACGMQSVFVCLGVSNLRSVGICPHLFGWERRAGLASKWKPSRIFL